MNALRRWCFLALSFGLVSGGLTPTAMAGTALLFDGTNDVVSVAGFGNIVPTNEVTVEFWQRVDRVKSQAPFILNPDQGANRFLASTPYSDSRVYLDYGNYTNRGRLSYAPSVSLFGSWQHFAFTVSVSGGFMRIYRNGVLEASTNTTSFYTPFAATLLLGGSATYRFGGMLDEVRIWNTVRSASQVQSNMNRTLTGGESNLVAYWNFEEGAGTVVGDASGHGRNGTAARSNAWVFSTAPIGAPIATTLAAVNVSANSATLTGTVFTANQTTRAWFEYGTAPSYGAFTATNTLSPATNNVPLARALTGLTANTTYHFRLVTTNGGGSDIGAGLSFTTPAARPAVTTLTANAITSTGARLRATVNPNGLASVAWFEYGLNTSYGTVVGATNLGAGVNNITFSNVIANLLPGRAYQFRVVATNGLGTNFGGNQSFTTPPAAPVVNTLGSDSVGATSARLVGSVNPNGAATRFFFQYGLTTNYGSVTTATNLAAGNLSLSLTGAVASLLPGNLYYFRALATNVAGRTWEPASPSPPRRCGRW
jgi:FlaG/FlaF family flagellin (archaellin)